MSDRLGRKTTRPKNQKIQRISVHSLDTRYGGRASRTSYFAVFIVAKHWLTTTPRRIFSFFPVKQKLLATSHLRPWPAGLSSWPMIMQRQTCISRTVSTAMSHHWATSTLISGRASAFLLQKQDISPFACAHASALKVLTGRNMSPASSPF